MTLLLRSGRQVKKTMRPVSYLSNFMLGGQSVFERATIAPFEQVAIRATRSGRAATQLVE